ncbi:MAG: NADH-quinone oxidoreductase subunit L [Bacillota bacterium]
MDSLFTVDHSYLIPLLPLAGAAVAGFFGARWLKQQSHWPIWIGVGISAALSILLLVQMVAHQGSLTPANTPWPYVKLASAFPLAASQDWYTWIQAGAFKATVGFLIDPLSVVMLCIVTGISFFITVYSKGYMAGEAGYFRFFAYMGLFVFAMTMLVMANNFVLFYLGWEGVGLCSYLLIGYYYERPAAREAAKKAFLVNRIGDCGFALGIMLIYVVFGTVSFFGSMSDTGVLIKATQLATDPQYVAQLEPWKASAAQWIPFLLMLGAFGKSAQFPLYVWLPDAMEGPTPVSALIHAATMVTAGVYMIVRCSTLFVINKLALDTVAAVGAFTAILAAVIALRQFDLKKVFAYSTISQLGFMFVGAAVLAPVAGMFHLATHAFFKALLFLSSGVVMHAMAGQLDMRTMSGLKRVLPWTRWFMLAGCLALAGVIPFSGFWSKDEIVVAAWDYNKFLGFVLLVTALLTAYYTFRLYFRVFEGPEIIPAAPAQAHGIAHEPHEHAAASEPAIQTGTAPESGVDVGQTHHAPQHAHTHEPLSMMLPLAILTLGAIFAGLLNMPTHALGNFLGKSPSMILGYNTALQYYPKAGINVPLDAPMFGQHLEPDELQAMGVGEITHATTAHNSLVAASILIAFLGILLAYMMHLKDRAKAEQLAARFPRLTRLLEAKFWVDEVYQAGIVEPLRNLGKAFFSFDRYVIDGIIWIVAFVPQLSGFTLKLTTQRGSLQGYAMLMLAAIAIILWIVLW